MGCHNPPPLKKESRPEIYEGGRIKNDERCIDRVARGTVELLNEEDFSVIHATFPSMRGQHSAL
jgi:hypothetical protein